MSTQSLPVQTSVTQTFPLRTEVPHGHDYKVMYHVQ